MVCCPSLLHANSFCVCVCVCVLISLHPTEHELRQKPGRITQTKLRYREFTSKLPSILPLQLPGKLLSQICSHTQGEARCWEASPAVGPLFIYPLRLRKAYAKRVGVR